MIKTMASLSEIKLVGISTRSSNAHIFESDPANNKIAAIVQKYFHERLAAKIIAKKNPGTTYCVYTNYDSDFNGEYTYFIGEEVTSFDGVVNGFETMTLPTQNYVKFTNHPGPMPSVCIGMWEKIWSMSETDLGGKRAYIADFEIYDERSLDHNNVTLDIYIGIKN